jgi:protein ImuB
MRKVLSIWLPHLPIERWAKASDCAPDAAVVLTVEGTHGLVIHAVAKAAAERGARPGARLTDARALDPGLLAIPADPAGDAALLERLATWAGRWSPLVEVDGPDGLRLDVSGVTHLFGGERGLARNIEQRFARLGFSTRIAIAPTAAAAWALARYLPSHLCGGGSTCAQRERGEGNLASAHAAGAVGAIAIRIVNPIRTNRCLISPANPFSPPNKCATPLMSSRSASAPSTSISGDQRPAQRASF